MRLSPVLCAALLLCGCAATSGTRPTSKAPDVAARHQAHGERQALPNVGPPHPARSVPTRLVGGPLVLRVIGATQTPLIRYALIFRLNRPYPRFPKDPDDRSGPSPLPVGAADPLGNVSLANLQYDVNHSVFNFDAYDAPDRDNCFFGNVTTDGLYLQVTSPRALAALTRIGCTSTFLT